jgi:two-component system response regulator AtoC
MVMSHRRVLIIDDEEGIRVSLGLILESEGYEVHTVPSAHDALLAARPESFDVVLCDVRMPGRTGLELLPDLIRLQPEATILMMSAFGEVEQALDAVRRGAYDFLSKPFQADELLLTIRKAEEREQLRRENRRLRRELDEGRRSPVLVAESAPMREVVELVERAAEFKTTVLITGESGVGKEVVARLIHDLSDRSSEPFIGINCAAIPESLIESELFGHRRGAFTGADQETLGVFREAEGGTLFLDEIGELPAAMQVKLLRVLQEEEVRPVGEPKPMPTNVRIVAATAREPESEVEAGRFRPDLFYRLNVLRIHIPPLRERTEDIVTLADQLLRDLSRRLGKSVQPLEEEVIDLLRLYRWPGNTRELENTLERALILAPGDRLSLELFPFHPPEESEEPAPTASDTEDLSIKRRGRALEEKLIRLALHRTGGNRTQAARILEISPRALQYKLKEYDIAPLNPLPADSDTR